MNSENNVKVTTSSGNDANARLAADACPHKKGAVIEIFETNNLPTITGDNTKYYDGFCVDCEKMVYGRTGKKVIRWTTDRNYAFGD